MQLRAVVSDKIWNMEGNRMGWGIVGEPRQTMREIDLRQHAVAKLALIRHSAPLESTVRVCVDHNGLMHYPNSYSSIPGHHGQSTSEKTGTILRPPQATLGRPFTDVFTIKFAPSYPLVHAHAP